LERLRRKIAPHIVSDLLSGVFHVADQHVTSCYIKVALPNAVISSRRRVENIAKPMTFRIGMDDGQRFSRSPKCSMSFLAIKIRLVDSIAPDNYNASDRRETSNQHGYWNL